MTYTLVLVQSLLMLLLPGSHRTPLGSGWNSVRLDVPMTWSVGETRYLAALRIESHGGATGEAHASGIAFSYSLKTDLASLSAIAIPTLPAGSLLADRLDDSSRTDALLPSTAKSPALASDQYASAARLYYVPAGISSFSGEIGSASASLDSTVSDPTDSSPGGGIGGGTGGGLGGGVPTPPDLGGGTGGLGSGGGLSSTPEPSSALTAFAGLAMCCRRRRVRH